MQKPLSLKHIFFFWAPLAATWLMMSVEGPFLSAIIARMAEPKYNLAAFGVAFSFALIIEAPVIMMMSASTALVNDRNSYFKLRNFTFTLNGMITVIMLGFIYPPAFYFVTESLIGLPREVSQLTHVATIILLPWPGAIGFRRFYQGILIGYNLTRRVAYGTVVRLSTMAATALVFYTMFSVSGVVAAASALSAGVLAEAVASRLMVWSSVKRLMRTENSSQAPIRYPYIVKFYYPLALTSMLSLAVHPLVTFFVGQSRMALESLAVLPVVNALVFIFRSVGLSYQEVAIALLGERFEKYTSLRNFAFVLSVVLFSTLGGIAFTPLADIWYHKVSGLSLELTQFAYLPTQIMTLMPVLTLLLSFQRALLVNAKHTHPITLASIIEVAGITATLFVSIKYLGMVGAVAACVAFVTGRLGANLYLLSPVRNIFSSGKRSA